MHKTNMQLFWLLYVYAHSVAVCVFALFTYFTIGEVVLVTGTVNFNSFIHKTNMQFFWLLYVYAIKRICNFSGCFMFML